MDKNIGSRLDGRYEITELIGVGGMADVYRATDVVDKKTVAVKILKKEFAENEEFLRRFRNESKAIAVLSHPNIVKIYDVGFSDKIQYIVMEYIDGITLKEYMETEKVLSWKDAVHFVTQILRALQHAHSRGIVHRDIKPQNIMMFPDGTIKVMDFGIAKFAREQGKTATDQAIGTVHYISPEQARGDVTDEKSDVYSVGVMLYEMLTGKKPFDTDNPVTIAVMHMQAQAERPRSVNPDIPVGLEEIILHAMEKNPLDRYQSAKEMLTDIECFKEDNNIVFGYGADAETEADTPTRFFTAVSPTNGEETADYDDEAPDAGEDDSEYVEEEEEEERRSLFVPILTAVTIAVIIAGVILITGRIVNFLNGGSKDKDQWKMPNLIGLNYSEAQEAYKDLQLEVIAVEYSSYEKDVIYEQSVPENDPVETHQVIKVKVSKGIKAVVVQDVTGWDVERAVTTLKGLGFKVETKQMYSDDFEEGMVSSTEPPANTEADPGDTILVYVSMGQNEDTIPMPDFMGKDIKDVKVEAELSGMTIVEEPIDSSTAAGTVIKQSVAPNTQVNPKKTTVTLSVSTGTAPEGKCKINFAVPSNAQGMFMFSFYDSGALLMNSPTINAAYTNGTTSVTVSGAGTMDLVVVLINTSTNRSETIGTYKVNFEKSSYTAPANVDMTHIFTKLGLVATQPPATTPPPIATTAPKTTATKPHQTTVTTVKPAA